MNIFKKFILINFILFFTSCGTIKEGFTNQKKNSSDEFLVEKKLPLVMPPNYSELPIAETDKNEVGSDEKKIKTLIDNNKLENIDSENSKEVNQDFEESLLEKIKKN